MRSLIKAFLFELTHRLVRFMRRIGVIDEYMITPKL
jgi:hypothetical protein